MRALATLALLAGLTGVLPERSHAGSKPGRPDRRKRAAAHKRAKRLRRAGQWAARQRGPR